jgi:hypothetical protein
MAENSEEIKPDDLLEKMAVYLSPLRSHTTPDGGRYEYQDAASALEILKLYSRGSRKSGYILHPFRKN